MVLFQNIQGEYLILGIILIPLIGSLISLYIGTYKEFWRDIAAAAFAFGAFFLSLLLFLQTLHEPVTLNVDWFMMLGLDFNVTPAGAFLALISSFIWFLATVFSWTYMEHEHSRNRYYYFLLLTEAGCLGVFLAGNLFTLFLFFEVMSIASYLLVVHKEKQEALDAGRNYLYLGVAGGLSLLLGIFILHGYLGTTEIASLPEIMERSEVAGYIAAALMIIGFGVKAGMVPIHIWLPKAHPVAPSPASALLSGIMIKTGAFGILLVTNMIFASPVEGHMYDYTRTMGFILIWIAMITMFSAAFMALFQSNVKRTLAFSSISQMGYILMGIGCAAYMGSEGMMGFTGSLYHILNHAFFKAGMFMMVGAVYSRTKKLDLSELGGLRKEFPYTAIAFAIAACGIAGIPLFNGYASKTLLHHAIEDSFYYGGHVSLYYAEIIFSITSALTVCYIFKITRGVFFGERNEYFKGIGGETFSEKIVLITFAAAILIVGIIPHEVLRNIIVPLSNTFTFEAENVQYLAHIELWVPYDLWNVAQAVMIGLVLYLIMNKTRLFEASFPHWLSIEYLIYIPVTRGILYLIKMGGTILDTIFDYSIVYGSQAVLRVIKFSGGLIDGLVDTTVVYGSRPGMRISEEAAEFDKNGLPGIGASIMNAAVKTFDVIYELWLKIVNYYTQVIRKTTRKVFFALIKADYDTKGDPFYQTINPFNYNFDLFIVWLVLLLLFLLIFFTPLI